jgi:hypothetical protein
MRDDLGYVGDFGDLDVAALRDLLELLDHYRIRLKKVGESSLSQQGAAHITEAVISGVRAALRSAPFLAAYQLYAPGERKLLMGLEPVTPMPPMPTTLDFGDVATLLLYPPGEPPDYTKRPKLEEERRPLFPLDPLLTYLPCATCDAYRVSALREVQPPTLRYLGLDPDCGHEINVTSW